MRIRNRIIRRLGGYTREDVRREVDRAKMSRPALDLGRERRLPVKIGSEQPISRMEDSENPMVRENLAYSLVKHMLRFELIRFLTYTTGSGETRLKAVISVNPPEESGHV